MNMSYVCHVERYKNIVLEDLQYLRFERYAFKANYRII